MRKTNGKRQGAINMAVWGSFAIFVLCLSYADMRVANRTAITTEVEAAPVLPPAPRVEHKDELKSVVLPLTNKADKDHGSDAATSQSKADTTNLFWMGWTQFESGASIARVGDAGHAYGRYQFDDRHCLAAFLQYCLDDDVQNFACFQRYVRKDSEGELYLTGLDSLAEDWKWLCYLLPEKFERLQTEFAFLAYYDPVRTMLLEQLGIEINSYSPVLKGTIMSCSVRNGSFWSNLDTVWQTYSAGISETEWLERIYTAQAARYPEQEQRWLHDQRDAAMLALEDFNSGQMTAEFEEVIFN